MRYRRRTKYLNVRLTEQEHEQLEREAESEMRPISEVVRDRLFTFPNRHRQNHGISKSGGGWDNQEGEE